MSEPHKCPVCKGNNEKMKTCGACKTTGIVWEPEVTEAVATQTVGEDHLDLASRPR